MAFYELASTSKKNPSMDFLWIEESLGNSSCAKPPSMAFYELASKGKKIHPCILPGLQNCGAIPHVAKPPSMFFYELASKNQKSLHGSLFVGKCRLSILAM